MDYVFVSRGKKGDGFNNEPAASHFLAVPETTNTMRYDHRITKAEWTRQVLAAARGFTANPNTDGNILFYVHGFNQDQELVLERHRKLKKGLESYGFNGVVVSFDWPSASSALNYLEDREDAKLSAFRLVRDGIATFAALQSPDCRTDLHVLAHSMGCYVVREAFDDADDRARIAGKSWAVSQIMMVAADVSVSSLSADNPKSSSLYRHCVRLTNYYNPFDDVLSISAVKRIGVAPRAGRHGLDAPRHEKSVNIYCGKHYEDTWLNTSLSSGHTWYFDDQTFLLDVFHTISGRLDRAAFPTRAPTDRGNLALKLPG